MDHVPPVRQDRLGDSLALVQLHTVHFLSFYLIVGRIQDARCCLIPQKAALRCAGSTQVTSWSHGTNLLAGYPQAALSFHVQQGLPSPHAGGFVAAAPEWRWGNQKRTVTCPVTGGRSSPPVFLRREGTEMSCGQHGPPPPPEELFGCTPTLRTSPNSSVSGDETRLSH